MAATAVATAPEVTGAKRRLEEVAGDKAPLEVECFYSLSSPWMYLGGPQLEDVVRRHRAKLILKPFDFQAVAPESGGIPLRTRPEPRRTYHAEELSRWRDYLGMPLNLQPAHYKPNFSMTQAIDPNWNKYPGWMVIAAQNRGEDAFLLSHALLRALWAEERDTADPAVRVAVANENGLDGAALQALEAAEATQEAYARYTEEARDKGVFGAPTFVVGGERFWGQDRLLFVDRKLASMRQQQQQQKLQRSEAPAAS